MLYLDRQHSERSLDAIHSLVVTTRSRLVSRKQPQFMLPSAEQHSGGPVGSVPLIVAVIRSRIGLDNRHFIGISKSAFGIQSEANHAHSDLVILGKTSRLCPSNYRSHSEQVQQQISETEPTRVQNQLERYRVSR